MYNIYETSDNYIVLGASEMHFAEAVLTKLGRPDLIPLCEPPPGSNQEPVRAFFRETFKTRTQQWWIPFEDVDAAFAPLNNLREAMDNPQVRHREMVVEDDAGLEHLGICAQSFRLHEINS